MNQRHHTTAAGLLHQVHQAPHGDLTIHHAEPSPAMNEQAQHHLLHPADGLILEQDWALQIMEYAGRTARLRERWRLGPMFSWRHSYVPLRVPYAFDIVWRPGRLDIIKHVDGVAQAVEYYPGWRSFAETYGLRPLEFPSLIPLDGIPAGAVR